MRLDVRAAPNSIRSSISRIELTYSISIVFFITNCILFPTTNKHSQTVSPILLFRGYIWEFFIFTLFLGGDNGVDSMVKHKTDCKRY